MQNTVLIIGASGVVGGAVVRRFLDDETWDVVSLSRRSPQEFAGTRAQHIAADLLDRASLTAALSAHPEITHLVYAATFEKPGLVAGWTDPEQISTNATMFANLLGALEEAGVHLRHATALQGTKAYGVHVGNRMRVPSKESQPRVEHDNFYFHQEDLLISEAERQGFTWTIFRPQFIFGVETGTVMNLIPVIGAYAALRARQGLPFSYPGGASYVAEAVDARLLGDAIFWAATAPSAENETFNITNGDVFEWRDLWPALADELGVEAGPDEPLSLAEWLPEQQEEWASIATEHGLAVDDLAALLGESHHYADFAFAYGSDGRDSSPVFVSTVKLRQAGFSRVIDTETMFREQIQESRRRGVLPPRA